LRKVAVVTPSKILDVILSDAKNLSPGQRIPWRQRPI
jgi:hypothetical protein